MSLNCGRITMTDLKPDTGSGEFTDMIREGLLTEKKYLPSKLFYDDAGSELF